MIKSKKMFIPAELIDFSHCFRIKYSKALKITFSFVLKNWMFPKNILFICSYFPYFHICSYLFMFSYIFLYLYIYIYIYIYIRKVGCQAVALESSKNIMNFELQSNQTLSKDSRFMYFQIWWSGLAWPCCPGCPGWPGWPGSPGLAWLSWLVWLAWLTWPGGGGGGVKYFPEIKKKTPGGTPPPPPSPPGCSLFF